MSLEEKSAFPLVADTLNVQFFAPGLTKREYFAAMAMQGILSSCKNDAANNFGVFGLDAKEAVSAADALIEALQS